MKKILAFVLVIAIVANAYAEDAESEEEKLCIKERRRALVSVKKNTDACREALVTTNKDGSETQPADGCLIKCVLNKLKALESDGKVTQASFETAVEGRATGKRRERILKTFDACYEKHAGDINAEDAETCPGYAEIGACLRDGIEEICEPDPTETPKDEL